MRPSSSTFLPHPELELCLLPHVPHLEFNSFSVGVRLSRLWIPKHCLDCWGEKKSCNLVSSEGWKLMTGFRRGRLSLERRKRKELTTVCLPALTTCSLNFSLLQLCSSGLSCWIQDLELSVALRRINNPSDYLSGPTWEQVSLSGRCTSCWVSWTAVFDASLL